MKLLWDERAWNDYLYWQTQDKRTELEGAIIIASCKGHYDD